MRITLQRGPRRYMDWAARAEEWASNRRDHFLVHDVELGAPSSST